MRKHILSTATSHNAKQPTKSIKIQKKPPPNVIRRPPLSLQPPRKKAENCRKNKKNTTKEIKVLMKTKY
jgi:hypothetical protein